MLRHGRAFDCHQLLDPGKLKHRARNHCPGQAPRNSLALLSQQRSSATRCANVSPALKCTPMEDTESTTACCAWLELLLTSDALVAAWCASRRLLPHGDHGAGPGKSLPSNSALSAQAACFTRKQTQGEFHHLPQVVSFARGQKCQMSLKKGPILFRHSNIGGHPKGSS